MSNHHLTTSRDWRGPASLTAAVLGAAFLYVRARTRKAERDNPPSGKFIEVDGIRLHYTERGHGQPLVLLHGTGILAKDFDTSGLAGCAASRYRVIAFDRPGFGYSERPRTTIWTPQAQAELLHKALLRLGIERPVVLGHSWGTLVALAMAIAQPGYVRGLVLVSGYYYPSLRLDVPLAAPPAIPVIGDLLRFTVSPLLGRLLWPLLTKRIFGPAPVSEKFRRLPVWMMLRPSQLRATAAESALMIPSAIALGKHYRELEIPVSIVTGEGDLIVNPKHNAERLHKELPGSALLVEPGVGHMVHYAHPDLVVGAVDKLLAQEHG